MYNCNRLEQELFDSLERNTFSFHVSYVSQNEIFACKYLSAALNVTATAQASKSHWRTACGKVVSAQENP